MLADLTFEFQEFIDTAKLNLPTLLKLMLALWIINLVNWLLGSRLSFLGIIPRKIYGLQGIVFSGLFHSNFNHLFFNSIPLFVLALSIISFGNVIFITATVCIILIEGCLTWCFGRPGLHIGASGLVSGYFGFVLATAYENPTIASVFLAVIALYYFGGILFSILPIETKSSWESHLFGFIGGLTAAYLCLHSDLPIIILNYI